METTDESLVEAGHELRDAIDTVIDAAADHRETEEDDLHAGNWVRSQTYAVLLASLDSYRRAQNRYDRVLLAKVGGR